MVIFNFVMVCMWIFGIHLERGWFGMMEEVTMETRFKEQKQQQKMSSTENNLNRNILTEDDNHLTEGNHNKDTNRGQTQKNMDINIEYMIKL